MGVSSVRSRRRSELPAPHARRYYPRTASSNPAATSTDPAITYWYDTNTGDGVSSMVCAGVKVGRSSS